MSLDYTLTHNIWWLYDFSNIASPGDAGVVNTMFPNRQLVRGSVAGADSADPRLFLGHPSLPGSRSFGRVVNGQYFTHAAADADITSLGSYTILALVRSTYLGNWHGVIWSSEASWDTGTSITDVGNGFQARSGSGTGSLIVPTSGSLVDGTWRVVAAVVSNGTVRVYEHTEGFGPAVPAYPGSHITPKVGIRAGISAHGYNGDVAFLAGFAVALGETQLSLISAEILGLVA